MTHSTEVHFRVPLLEDLYCINCRVEHSGSILNSIVKSLFHVQVLYCRLIIYSLRCCIASPSIQNVGDVVHVIVSKRFYATGKLQTHLANLKIKYSDPEPVHSKIYEACLKYTITFKLAPLWNCMGKSWYLYGDNFLYLPYGNDAIEWEIYYKGEETKIGLKPMKVNLFPFRLENVLPALLLENFKKGSTVSMNLGFESPQVFVLPKLTKGRVVSVSKILPNSSPFENYDIFRRHWKNMYSYRLPKTAEGMLFYEVVFAINPNQKFTYPEICLLSKRPEFLASDNKNAVASKFLKDLSESMQSICNEAVKIGRLYPELPVERSGQLVKDINYPIFPYRDIDTVCSPFTKTPLDEYVVKPPEKKVKLSNLFTFKGIDKMTPYMRDHSQKVLSIMNGQSKKTRVSSSSSQYNSGTSTSCNDEKFAYGNTRRLSLGNLSTASKRKTQVNDTDNICSFYEIPSMYPSKSQDFAKDSSRDAGDTDKRSNKELNSQAAPAFVFSQPTYPTAKSKIKPTIKNVETVNFDLNGIRKIRTVHEVYKANTASDESKNMKSKRTRDKEVTSPFFEQEKDVRQTRLSTSPNNVQKENSYRDENNYEMDVDKQFEKLEDENGTLKENREPRGKTDLRTLFSKFDSYNIGEEEDQHFEKIVHSECVNTPFAFAQGKTAQEKMAYQKFNDQSPGRDTPSPFSMSPIQTSPSMLHKYHSPEVSPQNTRQSLDETQFLEPTMPVTVENRSNTFCPSPLPIQVNYRDKNHQGRHGSPNRSSLYETDAKVNSRDKNHPGRHGSPNRSSLYETDAKECRKREHFFNFSEREESMLDQSISSNYTYELCGDTLVKQYRQSRQSPISQSSQVTIKNPQGPSQNNFSDEDEARYSPSLLDIHHQTTQKLGKASSQQKTSFQETRAEKPSFANCATNSRNNLESLTNSFNRALDSNGRFEVDRNPSPIFQSQGVKDDDKVFSLDELRPNNPNFDNSDFTSVISQSSSGSEPESSLHEHLKREYEEALTYHD